MTDFSADYFVTWGARHEDGGPAVAAGAPLPSTGKPLGKLNTDDLTAVIERGLKLYSKWLYFESLVFSICTLEVLINPKSL